jgi:hypothetical protein
MFHRSFAEELNRTFEQFEEKWSHSAQPPFNQSTASDVSPTIEIGHEKFFQTSSSTSSGDDSASRIISPFSTSPTHGSHSLPEEQSFERYLERRHAEAVRHTALNEEHYEQGDDVHMKARTLIDSVSQRGTGNHVCPYGINCTKGGVKDEKVLVFERNSAFR